MNFQEEKDRALRSHPQGGLESPFLGEDLFVEEPEAEWETRLAALEMESPFQHAFEQGRTIPIEPEELEEEFVEGGDETPEEGFPKYPGEPEQEEQFSEAEASHSEEELLSLEGEKDVFRSGDEEAILVTETLRTEDEAHEAEPEEEAVGLATYGQLPEGPLVPTPDDFLQYLEDLVDEEVFDEEAQSAQAEWQAYPAIHVHFAGKSPEERLAKYLEIRPLYQLEAGISNPARWIAENIITVAFFGRRTPCHRDPRAPLAAAENALRAQAFTPAIDSFWSFVPRTMRTRNKLSNHALGRAIDINYKTNPHIHNKEDILVIREATGVDLGRKQTHDAMRRASQLFQQTFNQAWVDRQTGEVRKAISRRKALHTYARAGFLNLEQPLIDALLNAGFTWGGDWQSEKDFMHFELPLPRRTTPVAQSAAVRPPSGTGRPPTELVRFAQRVLNATEGERLEVDDDLGPLTRAALERFRKKYNLGAGGVLDNKTQIAIAQRALEEISQQSLFGQFGVLDATTREALVTFKSERGLGTDAILDAVTRAAIADALAQRGSVPSAPVPVVTPSGLPKLGAGVTPPADPNAYRKFRLTTYHVIDQREVPTGSVRVPIYDDQGHKIAEGSPAFFAQLSLEGTARLTDGRLINVTGKKVPVSHDEYAEVLAYHREAYAKRDKKRREEGKEPTPTTYSGIVVENARVVRGLAFHEIPASRRGIGYGLLRGIPLVPFRTLAADIGRTKMAEPRWKGKGGLVPPGTHVYIKEYNGLRLPDGTTHDGWFVVNDTGGAIFGAHFDVFVGTRALRKQVKLPEFGQVWFAGIEHRILPGYTYGLKA